ncbi:MAG: hypothetical protein LBC40_05180, partial [Dysgonamonadaceae bacterium]|nr:hypothetical protein [Dysgonamonadaceae bacterium]
KLFFLATFFIIGMISCDNIIIDIIAGLISFGWIAKINRFTCKIFTLPISLFAWKTRFFPLHLQRKQAQSPH